MASSETVSEAKHTLPSPTRRAVLGSALTTLTASLSPLTSALSFDIESVFRIEASETVRPPSDKYDVCEFEATDSVLEFEADDVFVFGEQERAGGIGEGRDEFRLPGNIVLPLRLNIQDMQTGTSIFLVGMLATLFGAAGFLRNWAAGISTGMAAVLLIISGLYGFGLELFWLAIIASILLLIVGLAVRWSL